MVMTNGQRCDLHALARGFSHSVAGAQEASLVVERLLRITAAPTIAELAAYAKGALRSADSLLRGRGQGSGVAGEVSVVALVAAGTRWAVIWAGDLRCYLLHDGLTRCLTRDPVEVGLRRRPARTVGGPAQFACDIVTGDLSAGDRFLLVAADLARLVGERKIAAHLAEPRLADIPTAVIEEALLSGVGGSVGAVAIAATSPPNGDIP
jgi:type VI secretion system protein ImpM